MLLIKTKLLIGGMLFALFMSFSYSGTHLWSNPDHTQREEHAKTTKKKNDAFVASNIQNCGLDDESLSNKNDQNTSSSSPYARSAPCGYQNCFFYLKSNPEVGYLARKARYNTTYPVWKFKSSLNIYNLALRLEKKYGIRHFLMEPPYTMKNPSADLVECLNSQTYPTHRKPKNYRKNVPKELLEKWHVPIFEHDSQTEFMVIQKNRVAPTPSFLFGCAGKKFRSMEKRLSIFLEQAGLVERSNATNETSASDTFDGFARNVQKEAEFALKLLELEGGWLLDDFQVLIDKKGLFYYIDIGRNGLNWPGKFPPEWMAEHLSICRDSFSHLKELIHNATATNPPQVQVHADALQ